MRNFDPTPFWRSTIGFDRLFEMMDQSSRWAADDGYPPYNIERTGEDKYRISLAVAGFSEDDLTITAEQNVLTIEGSNAKKSESEYLYRGISARPFRRSFSLADYVHVNEASFENGLLKIDLVREVPDAMKPHSIPIGGKVSAIEQKKAA
jgi:molecular chaperone IbpA